MPLYFEVTHTTDCAPRYRNKDLTTGIPICIQESDQDVLLRQWKRVRVHVQGSVGGPPRRRSRRVAEPQVQEVEARQPRCQPPIRRVRLGSFRAGSVGQGAAAVHLALGVWTTAVWRCALTLCVAGGLAGVRDDWTGQAGAFQGCEATPVRQHQRTPWLLLSLRSHAHTPHVATRPPQVQTDERRHAVQDRGGAQPDPVGKHGRPAADGAGGREDVRHRAVLLAELVHQHRVTPCRGLAWATVRWYAHARYLAKHGQHGMAQYSRSTVGAVVTVVAVWLPAWPGSWHGQHEGCHLQRSRLHTPSLAESHGHRAQ